LIFERRPLSVGNEQGASGVRRCGKIHPAQRGRFEKGCRRHIGVLVAQGRFPRAQAEQKFGSGQGEVMCVVLALEFAWLLSSPAVCGPYVPILIIEHDFDFEI
jgi:hypothetical protein